MIPDRDRGTLSVAVHVDEVTGGVVRLFSPRPVAVGLAAELVTGDSKQPATLQGRVSRCKRLVTGLYAVSFAVKAAA
jgi:hypothetical protein